MVHYPLISFGMGLRAAIVGAEDGGVESVSALEALFRHSEARDRFFVQTFGCSDRCILGL